MKQELVDAGFEDLTTAEAVDTALAKSGTTLVIVNSVCGCAAGTARPGVKLSLNSAIKPDNFVSVFAGVDKEATNQARQHMAPYPPSSPCIALFKDGDVVHFVERHHIEGRSAEVIGEHLTEVYKELCK